MIGVALAAWFGLMPQVCIARLEVDNGSIDLIMKRLWISAAATAVAAMFYFSGSQYAISQQVTARTNVSSRSHVQTRSGPQVYLVRGFLNVFSLGMDTLATKLNSRGVSVTVINHTEWRSLADQIAAGYKAGRRGPIVLIGHSFGADAIMEMGDYLGRQGVPIALIVPFDGTSSHAASANVARVLNFYNSAGVQITPGPGFRGQLTNFYISDPNVSHSDVDDLPNLHAMVIGRIRALGK